MRRKIIKIDLEKCNGCGLCIPNCPEGALQIIDGKARLVSDLFCDGLGACIGHCPEGAISVEEREAGEYDERRVMGNIVPQGKNVIKAHLDHLKEHGQGDLMEEAIEFLKESEIDIPAPFGEASGALRDGPDKARAVFTGCPGAKIMDLTRKGEATAEEKPVPTGVSRLRQWPVLIMLVPPHAPFLKGADLLIAADCVPFAYADFHEELLKGRVVLVGCPKFDDVELYREKFEQIFRSSDVKSVTVAHMEVPCCFGMVRLVHDALEASGREIPFRTVEIGINGEKR